MTTRPSIERLADCAPVASPESWPARKPPAIASTFGTAYDQTCAELKAQAARTVRRVVKDRARAYALRPRDLEAIGDGMISLSPRDLVTVLSQLNAVATMRGSRWFGFGGEVQALNLCGARLYARYSRAKARQCTRRPT
jgi:hypothetical protein